MVARYYFRLIFIFLVLTSVSNSGDEMNEIEININEAFDSYKLKKVKIIDVRTLKEWKMTGVIPGSYLVNMHNEDFSENINFTKRVEQILNENGNHDIAFICASGARSEVVVRYFLEKKYKNVFHIPEGILGKQKDGWLYKGFPIKNYNGN